MRTGYVFLLFANRIFTEQETTNIVEDKHHHHQQQKQHAYLPHTMYFLFSFSLFFALYSSTQNMNEFLRMKLDVSKALQSIFHISHNATCFFQKKLCKAIFLICYKKGKGKFPQKDECISYKGTSFYYINADK